MHLRKVKEAEIFQEFQVHQTRMCDLLQQQQQQQTSDEDERIARAVTEQEAKREVLTTHTHRLMTVSVTVFAHTLSERGAREGRAFSGAGTRDQLPHEGATGREEEEGEGAGGA